MHAGNTEPHESPRASGDPLTEDPSRSSSKKRTILVDGFNVLHAAMLGPDRDGRWWRRELRERLLARVTRWAGGPAEIWVAFDGARPQVSVWTEPVATPSEIPTREGWPDRPTVHSVYVESADDWIVRRARRAEAPEQLLIVSADRKVAGRARSAGCEILSPWAFLARCPTEAAGETGPVTEDPPSSTRSAQPSPTAFTAD